MAETVIRKYSGIPLYGDRRRLFEAADPLLSPNGICLDHSEACGSLIIRPQEEVVQIKCILRKWFTERAGFLLHIHASVSEYVAELIFENPDGRNTLLLLGITCPKQISNLKSAKK